jgi:hypothetical protein
MVGKERKVGWWWREDSKAKTLKNNNNKKTMEVGLKEGGWG